MTRPRPYDLTTHGGKRVDWRTKAALLKAEKMLGYELTIIQGSYNAGGVSASAGTHDGGGAVDLAPWDWEAKVRVLRQCGFAAWFRPKNSSWNDHIHAVQAGNEKLPASAARQVTAMHNGRNGLADNGPDPHRGLPFKKFVWPYGGIVGLARWHRDQLSGPARAAFTKNLRRVSRGK